MKKIHLWSEERQQKEDTLTLSVRIELPDQTHHLLWYKIPLEHEKLMTNRCDPFVIATLMLAMNHSADFVIHGQVSPSLLRNLEEFQTAWSCWLPQRYQKIELIADEEKEILISPKNRTITAFSGGVDSCFSVYHHRKGKGSKRFPPLETGLMIHGFDIPLNQEDIFANAANKSQLMLSSQGVNLITIQTNFRELPLNWEDAHGTGIAACLSLFQESHNCALIPSTSAYQEMVIPFGSNPITDRLLSSDSFPIFYDGGGFTRLEKIKAISEWPEALQYLRVCWQGKELDRNCGKCEKCMRTILGFRVMGIPLPSCFSEDITDQQIRQIKAVGAFKLTELKGIQTAAKKANLSDPWVKALDECINRSRYQYNFLQLKQKIKQVLPPSLVKKIEELGAPFYKP